MADVDPSLRKAVFLANVCEWATITEPGNTGQIDKARVQDLVVGTYGGEWKVLTGSSAVSGQTPHRPFMCVYSQDSKCVALVVKASDTKLFSSLNAIKDWLGVTFNWGTVSLPWDFPNDFISGEEFAYKGFMNTWLAMRDDVLKLIGQVLPDDPHDWSIWITGHSLGGAFAQIAFVDWIMDAYDKTPIGPSQTDPRIWSGHPWHDTPGPEIYGCTFGAPMVANADAWSAVSRIVHLLQDRVTIGGAFYESRSEVLGSSELEYIGLVRVSREAWLRSRAIRRQSAHDYI